MKKQLLILFVLAFSTSLGYAQVIKKAQPDSLIKIIPFVPGEYGVNDDYGYSSLYTIGGKLVNKEDVVSRLSGYAPSAVEYNAVKKDITWGYVLFGGSAAATGGSIVEFYNNSKRPVATAAFVNGQPGFTYTYPHNNKTGAYILTGVAAGLLTAAFITLFVKAPKHMKKSVWLYNLRFE